MRRYLRFDWSSLPTPALRALTAINVGVFILWQLAGPDPAAAAWMQDQFSVSWHNVLSGRIWTLLTSEVSHFSLMHLAFNLLALWTFGGDVERLVGTRGFLHLYIAGGVLASVGHLVFGAVTGTLTPAVGASGAAMAIAVVSALLFPDRMLLVFFVIPMPIRWGVALFLLTDVLGMFSPNGSSVAHAAHLGGALYGWFYARNHLTGYLRTRLEALGLTRRGWSRDR